MKIHYWDKLSIQEKTAVLQRPASSISLDLAEKTQAILQQVKSQGDSALIKLTAQYDGVQLNNLSVSEQEINAAVQQINISAKQAIEFAQQQITRYHQAQIKDSQIIETFSGVVCERQARAIEKVGLYIPGGSAPLISTVLMLAVPAQIAGCHLRILCTPPNKEGNIDPHILYAAKLCGIQSIYKVGGAQAIAAMAYGTETIPQVNKIFGPGNSWVTQAKLLIAQDSQGASIDMPAGPSEVMVIADETANPAFVAADLLAQAEHGADSQVMLIALSTTFADAVLENLQQQLEHLSRKHIVQQALAHSNIIIAETIEAAVAISNQYAPEHLILQIENPELTISQITNAGAVFLGAWTPETLGDYVTGSNHVLPTYGYAKTFSGLSMNDFMKIISFQQVTPEGIKNIGPYAEKLAELEGLDAHKNAVTLRLRNL